MTLQRGTKKRSNVSVPARHKHFMTSSRNYFLSCFSFFSIQIFHCFVCLSGLFILTEIAPIRQMFNQHNILYKIGKKKKLRKIVCDQRSLSICIVHRHSRLRKIYGIGHFMNRNNCQYILLYSSVSCLRLLY